MYSTNVGKNAQIYVLRINYWQSYIKMAMEFGISFNI